MKALMLTSAILLACSSAPVFAQASDDAVATVTTVSGDVKASGDGGEFIATATGKALKAGDRLMVGENASITLSYDNGCERTYDKPSVYTVSAQCVLAATGSDSNGALVVAGGVAAGVAILSSLDDEPHVYTPPSPVSP